MPDGETNQGGGVHRPSGRSSSFTHPTETTGLILMSIMLYCTQIAHGYVYHGNRTVEHRSDSCPASHDG